MVPVSNDIDVDVPTVVLDVPLRHFESLWKRPRCRYFQPRPSYILDHYEDTDDSVLIDGPPGIMVGALLLLPLLLLIPLATLILISIPSPFPLFVRAS